MAKTWFDVKCGMEDFVLPSVHSCFYVFIYMKPGNQTRLLLYIRSNFAMKDIFLKQFSILINPAYN